MKKLSIVIVLMACALTGFAQNHNIYSFFTRANGQGVVRIETEELNQDTIVSVFHRADDIVWSRVVYRVIDMRYKQNFQLYFPTNPEDKEYWSLYRVIVDAVEQGMDIYSIDQDDYYNIEPAFIEEMKVNRKSADLGLRFITGAVADDDVDNEDAYILRYDSINDAMVHNFYSYERYIRNQIKYLIQEVVFFDKHTSRLYSKILGICPLQPDWEATSENPYEFLLQSRKFWVMFDDLRPYLAKKYMIPLQNEQKRVTFDEFFQKKMYSSYIVGDNNMYRRQIITNKYKYTEDEVKAEQKRIFDELLNFEQDLWEY